MGSDHERDLRELVDGDASYGELSALTILLGDGARIKILSAMLSEDFHDLSVTQIAELAGVHRTTVYDHLDQLEELGVVVQTREVGGSPMYQINQDGELARDLKRLEEDLLDELDQLEVAGAGQ